MHTCVQYLVYHNGIHVCVLVRVQWYSPYCSSIVLSVCVLYVVHIIGFRKKVQKLAKVKGCEEVGEWIKSMVNHLYWSAMSTESDDSQMLLEKWQSLANHIHNKHRGHGKKYKKCAHGRLGRRKWLKYSKSNIGLQSCFLIMSFV